MPMSPRTVSIAVALAITSLTGFASAKTLSRHFEHEQQFSTAPDFAMTEAPMGDSQAPAAADRAEFLRGSTIATFAGDVIVADADSGKLVRTDREGKKVASLEIGSEVAQLVVDAESKKAYVTDRKHDRIVVVDLADGLKKVDAFTTRAEPYGIALTPKKDQLIVTTVADKTLSVYDLSSGFEAWSLEIGHEPRGVALSADGKDALVTFLTTGVVGHVDLSKKDPSISYVSLDPAPPSGHTDRFGNPAPASTKGDQGRTFARNAFAAMFVGNDVAVVPHQLSTPHLGDASGEQFESSGYGGGNGFVSPITHRLAFLGMPDTGSKSSAVKTSFAQTNLHQPRAMAYDGNSDTLYVAGFGSDDVIALAEVSQPTVHMAWKHQITPGSSCGPNGLSVDSEDGSVVAFCSLTRKTVRLTPSGNTFAVGTPSAELAKSNLSASAQRGAEIFRRGNSPQLSTAGAMACSTCHPDVRADGLSWFLTGNILQTPFLTGRVMDSHPFKWDGKDHDLEASLTNTVQRLGGSGLAKRDVQDLKAFLAATPTPRTPTVEDHESVARGQELFESDATGCADCHYGALLTDQKSHEIAADLPSVDTPSLIGLSNSAPYYHDGSAVTLGALLRGKGNIHGMGRTSKLNDGQIGDLVAYMETL